MSCVIDMALPRLIEQGKGDRHFGCTPIQQNNSLKSEVVASGRKVGNSSEVKKAGFYDCLLVEIGNGAERQKKKGRISNPTLLMVDCRHSDIGIPLSKSLAYFEKNRSIQPATTAITTKTVSSVLSIPLTSKKSGIQPESPGSSEWSLACLRWRRLISPRKAETMNCPVLSLSSLTFSISSITSCGTRDAICVDLLLLLPVAISNPQCIRWLALYTNKNRKKMLKCLAPVCKVVSTLIKSRHRNGNAPDCCSSTKASNHKPLSEVTVMADNQSTQTRPKYQYRFLALNRHDKKATPCRLSVEASTEREARRILAPHFILSLAARLPVQGMVNITTPSGLRESLTPSTVTEISTVQEVRHA